MAQVAMYNYMFKTEWKISDAKVVITNIADPATWPFIWNIETIRRYYLFLDLDHLMIHNGKFDVSSAIIRGVFRRRNYGLPVNQLLNGPRGDTVNVTVIVSPLVLFRI